MSQVPDGRLTADITHAMNRELKSKDATTVSLRARESDSSVKVEGVSRSSILHRLGHCSLGHLTNSYVEQQIMGDEETHFVQERFYGLRAV